MKDLDKVRKYLKENELSENLITEESKTCDGCPAYQWVDHETGIHPCQLSVAIQEEKDETGNWQASPINPCVRPKTIGISYIIAKILNRPEPVVGKR